MILATSGSDAMLVGVGVGECNIFDLNRATCLSLNFAVYRPFDQIVNAGAVGVVLEHCGCFY